MVKILTGWSAPGGSTTAFINLTNELNKIGIKTCMYGPHPWHTTKCEGKLKEAFELDSTDKIISHYIPFKQRLECDRFVLSCHETTLYPISRNKVEIYDDIHFVSQKQYEWHNFECKHFILPNIHESDLKKSFKKPSTKTGGVIGSIDKNKNTHISIQKAIEDGCKYVLIFGKISEKDYYTEFVAPLVDQKQVYFVGYSNNKQKMYDCITDVYNYSLGETWSYIEGECRITETIYHSELISNYYFIPTEQILKKWIEVLKI